MMTYREFYLKVCGIARDEYVAVSLTARRFRYEGRTTSAEMEWTIYTPLAGNIHGASPEEALGKFTDRYLSLGLDVPVILPEELPEVPANGA